jgi:hypothetical protein
VNLLLRVSVLFHLLKHLFLGQTGLASRAAWGVTLVIVMLVIRAGAELRRVWILRVHQNFLLARPAMHQAHHAHNT